MKIIEKDFNVVTGEENITEREEYAFEKSERELFQLNKAQSEAETKIKATAKAALLAKLGITAEEATLLLS